MVDFTKKINSYIVPVDLENYADRSWRCTGIYKITNKVNGKCYVGQAIDIRARLQDHVSAYLRGKDLVLYRAIRKHGIDNFEANILVIINTFGKTQKEIKQELNAQETFYINLYNSYKNGYNMTPGGDCGRLGFKHSEETIKKIKEAHKNYKPKCAFDVSKKTYGYDLLNKVFIEGDSMAELSHKTAADSGSIGHICNNTNYKQGGRFIIGGRYLFSFNKEDLLERIEWYYSEEYQIIKKRNRRR